MSEDIFNKGNNTARQDVISLYGDLFAGSKMVCLPFKVNNDLFNQKIKERQNRAPC